MIEIDGSHGEGGGQILRTALALSAITAQPFRLYNIRKGRPREGLSYQHVKAAQTAARIAHARVEGLKLRSTELSFYPEAISPLDEEVDMGTAASITLLLQCVLPILLHAPSGSHLTVRGGTDVQWSPSWDYFEHITLRAIEHMGARVEARLLMRGYYPEGGGVVELEVFPSRLSSRTFERSDEPIWGRVHSSGLPHHVSERMRASAVAALHEGGYQADVDIEPTQARSTGCGITLWSGTLGACALGERGLPAERVGKTAAHMLLDELASGSGVDVHLADQLVLYMALAGGGECTLREITDHTRTNVWTVRRFMDVECTVHREGAHYRMSLSA
ncbi:MAG: RNA 3'-terminal phosphate cyclase [Methermicoccaceae archaeon]